MKFGDLVQNKWAGNKNPHKILMFINDNNFKITCLTLDGKIIHFYKDKDNSNLIKVGEINLDEWVTKFKS